MRRLILLFTLLQPVLFVAAASATTINAADNSFSVELGNGWQNISSGVNGEALAAQKGKASFTITAHATLEEAAAAREVSDTLVRLNKDGYIIYGKIQRRKIPSGGRAYFIHYIKNAAERRDGLFLFGGKTWTINSQEMTDIQFTELLDAVFQPDPAAKPAPKIRRAKPQSKPESAPESHKEQEPALPALQQSATEQAPQAATGAIVMAAPALSSSPVTAVAAQVPVRETATPPDTRRKTSYDINSPLGAMAAAFDLPGMTAAAHFLYKMWGVYLLIALAMLLYRLWHGRGEKLNLEQQGSTPYPLNAEAQIMAAMSVIYAAGDKTGGRYTVICPRKTDHFGITGIAMVLVATPVLHTAGIDALSGPCLFLGIALFIIGKIGRAVYPNRLNIFQKTGETVLTVKEKKSAAVLFYAVRDKKRRELAAIRNVTPLFGARHWQLYDCEGNLRAELKETDSSARMWARRLLGHQWGLLRGTYELLDNQGRKAGEFVRENVPKNRFTLTAPEIHGIDHRVMLAFILTADAETPDRVYPWLG